MTEEAQKFDDEQIKADALELRRAYRREWARANRDKTRATENRYWLKKARAMRENVQQSEQQTTAAQ